ncbi:hypothetical protein CA600_12525 [Paenibacillus sp. VTT E-133280]|jgi:hypothetical protein|uniref:hypothetical protein n=1 Tax=Paenibacillus sp. VTT E-133280 TaxID=1986222 RepID=UPI000B9FBBD5|nr:hypothetical protein [Paenibacillus sp. VTT E-133280]OZQ66078.1 hypothetical protein CA600_12525 [Paenibacillus sp. VTT E-133280]
MKYRRVERFTKEKLIEGIKEHESEFGERPEEIRMRNETWHELFNFHEDESANSKTEPIFFQGIPIIIDENLANGIILELVGSPSE